MKMMLIKNLTELYEKNRKEEVKIVKENKIVKQDKHNYNKNKTNESKVKQKKNNSIRVNKEIEEYLQKELKRIKENNNYENFLNSPDLQTYIQNYYYGFR